MDNKDVALQEIEGMGLEKIFWLQGNPANPTSILAIWYQRNFSKSCIFEIEYYNKKTRFEFSLDGNIVGKDIDIFTVGLQRFGNVYGGEEDKVLVPFSFDRDAARNYILRNYILSHLGKIDYDLAR